MKISMALAGLTAAALAGCAAPPPGPGPVNPTLARASVVDRAQCFRIQDVRNFATDDDRRLNVRVRTDTVYQLEFMAVCQDAEWAQGRAALVSRSGSTICSPGDAEFVMNAGPGPQRCLVRSLRKLTPAEITALSDRARP